MKTNFYIERLYSDNRVNIILSRRRWLEEVVDEKRNEFFQNTSEGDVVEGSVKSFTSFGAFVDLGGFDGLLHINDMSWGHVARPKDHVKKGEVLQLRVTRLDEENKKINLSLKDMTENPWDSFTERFQLHDVIKGKVTKLTDFGAFIELEEGIEGLAHIFRTFLDQTHKAPQGSHKYRRRGEAKILGFDLDARKVSLGVKQVMANPWMKSRKTTPRVPNSAAW
jgi:small subunit ribosomal protein S1